MSNINNNNNFITKDDMNKLIDILQSYIGLIDIFKGDIGRPAAKLVIGNLDDLKEEIENKK